jgi:hypothetical protein
VGVSFIGAKQVDALCNVAVMPDDIGAVLLHGRSAVMTASIRLCASPVFILVASTNTIHFQLVGLAV